jgi:hypothetical protein
MHDVTLNQPITFGRDGLARKHNPCGISFDEDGFSWTTSRVAQFDFRLPTSRFDLKLEILAGPFVHEPEILAQDAFVYLNGLFQNFLRFDEQKTITCEIAKTALSPRGNRLAFVLPTAKSPQELGLNSDLRVLGLALRSVTFISS